MSENTKLKEEELQQQQVAPEAATPAAPAEVEAATPAPAEPVAEPAPVEEVAQTEPLVAEDTTADAGTFTAPEPGMIPIWIHAQDVSSAVAMSTGDAEAAGTAPDATATENQINSSPVDTAEGQDLAPAPEPLPESKEVTEEKLSESEVVEKHDDIDDAPEKTDVYAHSAAPIHSGSDSQSKTEGGEEKKMTESEEDEESEEEEIEDISEEDISEEDIDEDAEDSEIVAEDNIDLDAELDKIFNFEAEINTDDKEEAVEETVDIIKDATDFLDSLIDEDNEDLVKDEELEDVEDDESLDFEDVDLPATDDDEEDEDFDDDDDLEFEESDDLEDDQEELTESKLQEASGSNLPEELSDILYILADPDYLDNEEMVSALVSYIKTAVQNYELNEDEAKALESLSEAEDDYAYEDELDDDLEDDEDAYYDYDDDGMIGIHDSVETKAPKMREEYDTIYPAGSAKPEDMDEDNLVKAYSESSAARRRAYSEFRKSMNSDNPRFREALRSTSRISRKDVSENSWNNNKFEEKYEERSQLDFAAMLKNGFLG